MKDCAITTDPQGIKRNGSGAAKALYSTLGIFQL